MGSGQWVMAAFAFGAAMGLVVTAGLRAGMAMQRNKEELREAQRLAREAEAARARANAKDNSASADATSGAMSSTASTSEQDMAPSTAPTTTENEHATDAANAPAAGSALAPTAQGARAHATGEQATPETSVAPAASTKPAKPAEPPLRIDMDELADTLFHASDPIAELKRTVGDVRTAEAHALDGEGPAPSATASYLARGLDEAGLFSPDAGSPDVSVVRPSRSKTFYLHINDESLPWPDMVRLLAIEGALNRALFAWEHFEKQGSKRETSRTAARESSQASAQETTQAAVPETSHVSALETGQAPETSHATPAEATSLAQATSPEPPESASPEVTLEDCYRFNQALASSITAQLGSAPLGHASMSDVLGEWGARQAIAAGIETFRLPLRLSAQFRVNLMGGDAAIVADYVPAEAFAASVWSEELGRIIPASHQMREQAASTYAMRVALLLASHAFRCSRRLCHVFVAITLDSPARHECLLSGDVAREALAAYDLSRPFDAQRVASELGLSMHLVDGALTEVEQGFSLDEERFCPRTRYESVDLSGRILPRFESALLGAKRVSDLAINENAHRAEVAQTVARALGPSTEHNVREILELTRDDKDETVREAGERTAERLIDGTLSDADPLAFSDEFINGDDLSRACERAVELLRRGRARDAVELLTDVLAPLDALDVYRDTDTVSWREFMSYVDRALYNRLLAEEGREVRLVPDAYYNAQLLMSTALLASGRVEQALGFARRAQDLDPLSSAGTLRVVRCLELLDRRADAAEELRHQLELAFDPESVGVGYYRLAFMEWRLGNIDVADACYQKAMASRSTCASAALLELQTMRALSGSGDGVDPSDVEDVLERAHVPLAPTDRVLTVLVEAAQAATDAEVFPVARSFATLLGALSGDDVMRGVTNSIELEPDR